MATSASLPRDADETQQLAQLAQFDQFSTLLRALITQGAKTKDAVTKLATNETLSSSVVAALTARLDALEQRVQTEVSARAALPLPSVLRSEEKRALSGEEKQELKKNFDDQSARISKRSCVH
jgi:hypothetical protein